MSKVTAFITDGTEESECLIAVDLLRRAGIETELVSWNGSKEGLSSHKIRITVDKTFEEASFTDSDMLFIPGGMPGVTNLTAHEGLAEALKAQAAADKYIAAVCAGPSVLGGLGLLEGKKADLAVPFARVGITLDAPFGNQVSFGYLIFLRSFFIASAYSKYFSCHDSTSVIMLRTSFKSWTSTLMRCCYSCGRCTQLRSQTNKEDP